MTKKIRFEIFKRDSFTCQYCGKKSPDAILRVDHIKPLSKGGSDEILNLITSCFDCKIGKGDRELDDKSFVEKTRKQAEALQAKREQIEMMFEWHESLSNIEELAFNKIVEYFDKTICNPSTLNDFGKSNLKRAIKKYPINECLEAIDIATKYVDRSSPQAFSKSITNVLSKIGGILKSNKKAKENPHWGFILRMYYKLKREVRYIYLDNVEKSVMSAINKGRSESIIEETIDHHLKKGDYGDSILDTLEAE
jgi:hypothetical protein